MFSLRSLFSATRQWSPVIQNISTNFHLLASKTLTNMPRINFLVPESPVLVPNSGFKVMGKVRRRCKDCYMVRRDERLYIICKTHRRHKQMSMIKSPRNTWILSHATQSKTRPW